MESPIPQFNVTKQLKRPSICAVKETSVLQSSEKVEIKCFFSSGHERARKSNLTPEHVAISSARKPESTLSYYDFCLLPYLFHSILLKVRAAAKKALFCDSFRMAIVEAEKKTTQTHLIISIPVFSFASDSHLSAA